MPPLRFSQRKGYTSVKDIIQREGMDDALRNSLWNVLDEAVWNASSFYEQHEEFSRALWFTYFQKPLDTIPRDKKYGRISWGLVRNQIREYFFNCEWYEVYDFLEFTLRHFESLSIGKYVNLVLENNLAGYRFVGGRFTDITDEQEIESVEAALADNDFPGVRAHLRSALELLSDRNNPQPRNSIKESISAVEALAQIIAEKRNASLGDALNQIESTGKIQFHGALKEGFRKLYGYTSSADGIRHAMMDEPDLSSADAKYFLVSCSAFINYLKSKM